MNNDSASDIDYHQTEEGTLTCEISDDALEAPSGTRGGPTLFHSTYCFGCPVQTVPAQHRGTG
jgi:hypothetical protein